jgi:hypothetical protein
VVKKQIEEGLMEEKALVGWKAIAEFLGWTVSKVMLLLIGVIVPLGDRRNRATC